MNRAISARHFIGALLVIGLLGQALTVQFDIAATLIAIGMQLHLTERHLCATSAIPISTTGTAIEADLNCGCFRRVAEDDRPSRRSGHLLNYHVVPSAEPPV